MIAIPAKFISLGNGLIFSPLGLSFNDDFTQQPQFGYVIPTLLIETPPGTGTYVRTGVRGLFTKSGILAYPNLGRRGVAPALEAARNYRVTFDTQFYIPLYPSKLPNPAAGLIAPGFDFAVKPYDDNSNFDTTGASPVKPTLATLTLLPAANYPFGSISTLSTGTVAGSSGVTLGPAFLTGTVVGGSGVALVSAVEPYDPSGDSNTNTDCKTTRVVSDINGRYRMPLRWGNATTTKSPPTPTPTTVTAWDSVSGKTGSITLTFPYDLTKPLPINIS
jgi:hypothetical protein